ncbi:DUF397 domain-containing protein [Actinomadura darangshiensis]|uniref:DUF397 domain-containing protein n=1 Tax=Actinomadura darangshiensis TaxID=705336 RepID=A0A4R5BB80_9ACTN|nr:DUF397 domain-containing protein [Actinomadura darangshiensis]TDD80732.1 DUF397 domain-containing protein [Actinomadura darangshiensis]
MTIYWRKSSRSGSATDEACVELATFHEGVGLRDSKDPDSGRLVVNRAQFGSLLQAIKEGALDRD